MSNNQLIALMLDAAKHSPGDRRAILGGLNTAAMSSVIQFLQSFTSAQLYPTGGKNATRLPGRD